MSWKLIETMIENIYNKKLTQSDNEIETTSFLDLKLKGKKMSLTILEINVFKLCPQLCQE